jgi:hypothetical protein
MTQGKQERIYTLQSPTVKGKDAHIPGSEDIDALSITPRSGDTRHINASHAVELAESIAILGLLQPLGIDTSGSLLTGGHRLAALQLLLEPSPENRRKAFLNRCGRPDDDQAVPDDLAKLADRLADLGQDPLKGSSLKHKVPVLVIDVSGKKNDGLALAVEVAENSIRRQYTHKEIVALAKRLEEAGYKSDVGNPKAGERTKLGMLTAAVGKSKRQIQRILEGPKKSNKTAWDKSTESLKKAVAKVVKASTKKGKGKAGLSEKDKKIISMASELDELLKG